MSNVELVTVLFENHLNTITIILSVVGVIFVMLGLVSYSQIMKHVKQTIDSTVQNKVDSSLEGSNIKGLIEKELNRKIENYHISIQDVTNENKKQL